MKTTIKRSPKLILSYPRLMANDVNVVLFSKKETGVVLSAGPGSQYPVGYTSNMWREEDFEDFKDELILSND